MTLQGADTSRRRKDACREVHPERTVAVELERQTALEVCEVASLRRRPANLGQRGCTRPGHVGGPLLEAHVLGPEVRLHPEHVFGRGGERPGERIEPIDALE